MQNQSYLISNFDNGPTSSVINGYILGLKLILKSTASHKVKTNVRVVTIYLL